MSQFPPSRIPASAFYLTVWRWHFYAGIMVAPFVEVRFKDFGYLAQFMLWAIIAHEGQLFGLTNQILGTIAAAGVLLLGISFRCWALRSFSDG